MVIGVLLPDFNLDGNNSPNGPCNARPEPPPHYLQQLGPLPCT